MNLFSQRWKPAAVIRVIDTIPAQFLRRKRFIRLCHNSQEAEDMDCSWHVAIGRLRPR